MIDVKDDINQILSFKEHKGDIRGIRISGDLLVSGANHSTVKVWKISEDLESLSELKTLNKVRINLHNTFHQAFSMLHRSPIAYFESTDSGNKKLKVNLSKDKRSIHSLRVNTSYFSSKIQWNYIFVGAKNAAICSHLLTDKKVFELRNLLCNTIYSMNFYKSLWLISSWEGHLQVVKNPFTRNRKIVKNLNFGVMIFCLYFKKGLDEVFAGGNDHNVGLLKLTDLEESSVQNDDKE